MIKHEFHDPISVKGREFLRRPVPTGILTSLPTVAIDEDDSWIYEDLPVPDHLPIVVNDTREPHVNKGGRPRGSTKKRSPTVYILRVTSQESAELAVIDILWRARRNAELTSDLGRRKLTARQIVQQMELSGISEKNVYGIINRMVSQRSVEYERGHYYDRQGKLKRKELLWLDSKRQGWYWQGQLWSERALAEHPHCKVSRPALHKRLVIEGLSVDMALRGERKDNAREDILHKSDNEWVEI